MDWHSLNEKTVLKKLETRDEGLTPEKARERLSVYGYNELVEKKKKSALDMFLSQFKNILIIILIIAAAISAFLLNEYIDAAAIFAIVILNAILGFRQEYQAEKALEALKKLAAPKARVLRDGEIEYIPARELVPGDIVLFEAGDKVPADIRILEAVNVRVDESLLTGESTPVEKEACTMGKHKVVIGDMKNMLFMGTVVTYGRGRGVVVATGMRTEVGKIAEKMQEVEEEETPLQKMIDEMGKQIGTGILLICALIFVIGVLRKSADVDAIRWYVDMFLVAVSLAVAAIPEGLPAIVTISLAIGLQRMAQRNAIVRKLPAVETLGSTMVICSDKTGTLTRNEMLVRAIYVGRDVEVTGTGYETKGDFYENGKRIEPKSDERLMLILKGMALCNNAKLSDKEEGKVVGDPTEAALLVAAAKAFSIREIEESMPRVKEIPFDSDRKRMGTVHKTDKGYVLFVKGAPEIVISLCDRDYSGGELGDKERKRIIKKNEELAQKGMRVLAIAYRELGEGEQKEAKEENLVFLGLVGMMDQPRDEAKEAVRICKEAGIRVIMITGDHKITALAVAKELGITAEGAKALTGEELNRMSDEELFRVIDEVDVYARVSPEHKLRIVNALKRAGYIVAMTGDGVNDAPALRRADIGIAMGITGTDVSKEASDMILLDDNFATIQRAVEEGRVIYNNIRKSVYYLLSCNAGEVMTIFIATLINPVLVPLLPIQLLWMNLVTDGLPALALGVDPPEPDIMKKKPRDPKEKIITKEALLGFILVGFIIMLGTLGLFVAEIYMAYGTDAVLGKVPLTDEMLARPRTVAFTAMVLFQMFLAFASRSFSPLYKVGIFTNKKLVGAVLLSVALQIVVVYWGVAQPIFNTVPLSLVDWALIVGVASSIFFVVEGAKIMRKQ
ncbi:MAG: calcium-translocating P-type ATPase, SERCA-type [Candidatus Micrarchaeia archaeon]